MEGYPQLAVFQGKHPELRIYRRFSTLNARNLLYLQAELVDLEQKLDRYTTEDLSCDNPQRKKFSRNWHALSKRNNGLYSDQWRTMLCLREKLKEYNDCLLQQRQLAAFDEPEGGNLESLNKWLKAKEQGNRTLEGLDRDTWMEGKDLLATFPSSINDSFTRLVQKPLLKCYHRFNLKFRPPTDLENNVFKYEERTVLRAADIVGTIISSSLPILAVVVLYFVRDMLKRLGMVALFTILFSLALITTTKAKRIEIFAATAAFASVQVVFVGSTSV